MQANNSNSIFYSPSPVPNDTKDLQRYLQNEFSRLQDAILQLAAGHVDVTSVAPAKPREGDIRLCDGTAWNPVSLGKRFVGFRGGAWVDLG